MELLDDQTSLAPEALKTRVHARMLSLKECLSILASPDSKRPLSFCTNSTALTDTANEYQLFKGLPLLIPKRLQPYFHTRLDVPFEAARAGFLQYFLLATIKQSGDVNAPSSSLPFHRHLFRASEFLAGCEGIALDVGCDDPALSASIFPPAAEYLGLDPFCARTDPFRIIGLGECLPILDGTVDNVLFNTSLDHIMDWHLALEEAHRVLKPEGTLYLFSYVWTERANILEDTVHFHHFRDYELLGKVAELGMILAEEKRFVCPKGDSHRHEMFIRAVKH